MFCSITFIFAVLDRDSNWVRQSLFVPLTTEKKLVLMLMGSTWFLTAHFIGKNITIIWSGGVWTSDEVMEHQVILVHKGQQVFICTEVGTHI